MKFDTVNGCGACSGWLSWIKPPHHKFFKNACILHDELYNLGGTEEDRKKADKRLFSEMVKHSQEYFTDKSISSQWWFVTLAYGYYKAVRWFGKGQFNYH
ncbi:MAG: hypothetical protein QM654_12995 [Dysgonamonadaceae bacterium]